MGVINQAVRNRKIAYFVLSYLVALLFTAVLFYFLFVVIPRINNRNTALTNERIEEFVKYTDEADSLVIQIQKAPVVEAEALIPFFKWTNDLKTVYDQPFYSVIVNSYTDLVNDIALAKGKDTTLPSLKNKLVTIQKANLELMQLNEELKRKLKEGKTVK